MAYTLQQSDDERKQAVCVLLSSRIGPKRLAEEVKQFQCVLRPNIAARVHMLSIEKGREFESSELDREFKSWAREAALKYFAKEQSRAASQEAVLTHLVRTWLAGGKPEPIKAIQEATTLSYPTVAKALERLEAQDALTRTSDRSVALRVFPWSEWKRWAAGARDQNVLRFVDPTGLPASPDAMVRRLGKLNHPDLAVSGILGAKHHFPALDIRGDIRLDLVLNSRVDAFDLDLVKELDPALELTDDPRAKAVLVIRCLDRRRDTYFEKDGGLNWADPVECLADLYDLGLEAQANEMLHHLVEQRERKL